jgi:hypothetical protein
MLFGAVLCMQASGLTNTIVREIRTVDNEVRVFDRLHLKETIWKTRPELQPVYVRTIEGHSNMLGRAAALLSGENLLPIDCKASLKQGFLDLSIISKVSFDSRGVAKLHFASTYGVVQYQRKIGGMLTEPYFLVYSKPGIRLAWMPAWDTPEKISESVGEALNSRRAVEEAIGAYEDVVEVRCFINDGTSEQALLLAYPWAQTGSAPPLKSLEEVSRFNPMSGNDVQSLFTDLRPAKPGYYLLDRAGFTNRPPLVIGGGDAAIKGGQSINR